MYFVITAKSGERGNKVAERTVNPETLKSKIGAAKITVKEKYSTAKNSAKKLALAYDAMLDAEERKDTKNSAKTLAKFAVAENGYMAAIKEYKSVLSLYDSLVEDVIGLYEELIAIEKPKALKRARAEAEKFERQEKFKRDKILGKVSGIKDISTEDPEFYGKEEKRNPSVEADYEKAQPKEEPIRQYSQGVSIAPMSIDISSIVEEAVSAAMEKFKAAFAKKADSFIAQMPVVSGERANSNAPSGAVAEIEEKVLEDEKVIIGKLSALTENLKTLSNEITELGAAYMQLANKQQDAAEMQRKINDMQRAVSREIQGVQANQKVINQDQAALSGEQAFVLESEKANLENQKLLNASQESVAEMQKTVIETQSAIEESMREVMNSQKDIIALQQTVINGNAKNIELQRALAEKQSEVTNLQKTVMSEHKQLARSQRAVNNKNKQKSAEKGAEKQTVTDKANEIVEDVQKIELPEEVELNELSADEEFKA